MSHEREETTNPGIAAGMGADAGFAEHDETEGTEEVTQVDHPERHAQPHGDTGTPADFDDAVLNDIAIPSETTS